MLSFYQQSSYAIMIRVIL